MDGMTTGPTPGRTPDRDECIEQAYFFRTFRDRLLENMPAQEVLGRMHEELLTTTRLPYAVEFLATELKHSGLLATGFDRLPHYFTPFQVFVVRQAEEEGQKFTMPTALLVLEREATYKANDPLPLEKMQFILDELHRTAYSTVCPHGRPVMLRLTRREIEKNFLRM